MTLFYTVPALKRSVPSLRGRRQRYPKLKVGLLYALVVHGPQVPRVASEIGTKPFARGFSELWAGASMLTGSGRYSTSFGRRVRKSYDRMRASVTLSWLPVIVT